MLREFKPRGNRPDDIEPQVIAALFEKGEFKRALGYCREMGYVLDEFSESLSTMGKRMLRPKPGELLALVYKHKIDVGYDVPTILRSQFRIRDYHGFLKNVHRFKAHAEFEAEIKTAILSLARPAEAATWRNKFARLLDNR